ncbi:MAG: shikimate kinase [Pirellulales bacterium]
MNIALIGYRGTGKTSIAQRLSLRLGWPWIDADVEIELAAGKSVATIFSDDGEERFRDLEVQITADLAQRDQHVLAFGGGVVLRDENRQWLRRLNAVIWLTAKASTIQQRMLADPATVARRPNLTSAGGLSEIIQLLTDREPFYRECADIAVDTEDRAIEEIVDDILDRLGLSNVNPDSL